MQATHSSKLSKYVGVFVGLAILTAIEVGVAIVAQPQVGPLVILLILLGLAGLKALLVASFFMHLRDDTKWFTLIFIYPMFLATLLIISVVFERLA